MHILILRSDGGVCQTHISPRAIEQHGFEQVIAYVLDQWEESVVKEGWTVIGYREIVPGELPRKRFRGAWTMPNGVNGAVVVDLNRARVLRKLELERMRNIVLERLREKIENAEDNGQTVKLTTLRAKRRAFKLADLEARVNTVNTVEELETYIPPEYME